MSNNLDLIKKAQKGDKESIEELIKSNQNLVVSIVKKYVNNNSSSFEDLIQEGNLGLWQAIEKFDVNSKYEFSTYAVYWIKANISRYIQNDTTIRKPNYLYEIQNKINKLRDELTNQLNREPTNSELAIKVNITEKQLTDVENGIENTDTLDVELINVLQNENSLCPYQNTEFNMLKEQLSILLDKLQLREKQILELRYGLNGQEMLSMSDIGSQFNISRERVRTIINSSLKKLETYGGENLREFL